MGGLISRHTIGEEEPCYFYVSGGWRVVVVVGWRMVALHTGQMPWDGRQFQN